MKLLFDANIFFKIISKLEHLFPESKHVTDVRLINIEDKTIFEYAKQNDFCIVSFDEDFNDLSMLNGYPPKVIWLRTGNTSTSQLTALLISKFEEISKFLNESESNYGCLEIY
jgi:predicted nuclease of predicted toxin-antitoxin system